MDDVNERFGQVTVGGYFRMQWRDPRIAYNSSSFPRGVNLKNYKPSDVIWIPDIYIDNLVKSHTSSDAVDMLTVSPDGLVYRSYEVLWTIKCDLQLGKLPFDEQNCAVVLGSYSENEDIVRVTAIGGSAGAGVSGIGIKSEPLSSVVWDFPGSDGDGFETPGRVEVKCYGSPPPCWDFLHLTFSFSRKPTYYYRQVLVPDGLFLGVSYTGFYVDPNAAPARAAVAVIPLLIMLTLLNNVYNTLPKTSESMWLTDYLLISLFFSSFAALEFAFVQLFLNKEKKRAANLQLLKSVEKEAIALVEDAKSKGKTVLELLSTFAVQEVDMEDEPETKQGPARGRRMSDDAKEQNIKEANLGVIEYARDIFEHYDDDNSECLSPKEIRKVLAFFNIYLTDKSAATVICMFMRDKGETTPKDESLVQMQFGIFLELLIEVRKYLLKVSRHSSFIAHFKSSPPSSRLDMTCRILFPSMVIIKMLVMLFTIFRY